MIQKHRDALAVAEDHAANAEERIADLEKERIDLIQKHRDVLAATEVVAEERIAELKKEKADLIHDCQDSLIMAAKRIQEPESGELALVSLVTSSGKSSSPSAGKRKISENEQDGDMQQRYGRTRASKAAKAIDGDTIVVCMP